MRRRRRIAVALAAAYAFSMLVAFGQVGAVVRGAGAVAAALTPVAQANGNGPYGPYGPYGKVTICHHADSKRFVTITVSEAAVPAHLAHGDTVGPCP